MEDYTKFKLKKFDELKPLILGSENPTVISCNKCFKEFTPGDEPELSDFLELVRSCGKAVSTHLSVDFLCNKATSQKTIESCREGFPHSSIFVIACGLGTQIVADLLNNNSAKVYTACDSVSYDGEHGMALTDKRCVACGQCFLSKTGGICPLADCSKGLLNGQCGGSRNGKCEISEDKDCAWNLIDQRLRSNKTELCDTNAAESIQIRDFSKVNEKQTRKTVQSIRNKRFAGFYGGVYLSERKSLTEHLPLVSLGPPQIAIIPLLQHIGKEAVPLVKSGDLVKTGQKIGALPEDDTLGSSIHSSISGCVTAVEPLFHPSAGKDALSVIIASDGKDELHDSVTPIASPEALTPVQLISIIKDKGIVGMGGAGFPTYAKLNAAQKVDTVLLNGCECEPFLTADFSIMTENAKDVISGFQFVIKAVSAKRGFICIEENKLDLIENMTKHVTDIAEIDVVAVKTKYPQGAEKILVKHVLRRQIPSGGYPTDVGALVINVSTVKAVYDAIIKGMPLIERAVTVSGDFIKSPGNFIVRIGTPVKTLIDSCGGFLDGFDPNDSDNVFVQGGSMMGAVTDFCVPIIKTTNGVLALEAEKNEAGSCIRCGRCSDVCPMELLPLYFAQYLNNGNLQGIKDKNVFDCIECRCCDYICPSRIRIVEAVKNAKSELRNADC